MLNMNIHGVDFSELELKEACRDLSSVDKATYDKTWDQILDGKLNTRLLDWRKIVPKNKNCCRN